MTVTTIDPATSEPLAAYQETTPDELDAVLAGAHAVAADWRITPTGGARNGARPTRLGAPGRTRRARTAGDPRDGQAPGEVASGGRQVRVVLRVVRGPRTSDARARRAKCRQQHGRQIANTDELNERSHAALAALPAQFEGVVRDIRVLPNGRRRSSAVYSILDREWKDVQRQLTRRLAAHHDGAEASNS